MKVRRTWVLVADGARARIVRQMMARTGEGEAVDDLVFEAEHKRPGEIMADRPGRAFASEGARRSAMEYHSDPEREEEARFAATLAGMLERHRAEGAFDALAIVAEPRMLGLIRQSLPGPLRDIVESEVAKDLTKLPAAKLRAAIRELGVLPPHASD